MKRASLYSSSRAKAAQVAAAPVVKKAGIKSRFQGSLSRNRGPLLAALPGVAALAFVVFQWAHLPPRQQLPQEDIDLAVTTALQNVPLPSSATKAYEAVRGSIVRVRAFMDGPD